MEMNNLIAVSQGTEGILGKFFTYSLDGILVKKETLKKIGADMGFPKICPARESKSSAYHRATTALKDRIKIKSGNGLTFFSIYCRNNKKDNDDILCRELIKEVPGIDTNEYVKLANIIYDKQADMVGYGNIGYDPDIDINSFCERAISLFDLYRTCYDTTQIDSVIKSQLENMNAVKISVKGNLYFVPKSHLNNLSVLEDYIEVVGDSRQEVSSDSYVYCNSMYVVDDEKQRKKMTDEFYRNFEKTLDEYQERVQKFIDGGCKSKAVIDRWLQKLDDLSDHKKTYELVLKQQLGKLDDSQAMLQMQMDELRLRATEKNQMTLDNAA